MMKKRYLLVISTGVAALILLSLVLVQIFKPHKPTPTPLSEVFEVKLVSPVSPLLSPLSPLPTFLPPSPTLSLAEMLRMELTATAINYTPTFTPTPDWRPSTFTPTPVPEITPKVKNTPAVTPIPVTTAPWPADTAQQPFRIIIRDGNCVWSMSNDGSNIQLLIDTYKSEGLHLGRTPFAESGTDCCFLPKWGAINPDGTRLALVLTDKWKLRIGDDYKIWISIYDIAKKELRYLDIGIDPVWSPDGSQIAYRGHYYPLWIANADTLEKRELISMAMVGADAKGYLHDYVWSPDGKK